MTDTARRFSQIYLGSGNATDDSPRMRRRIASLAQDLEFDYSMGRLITSETGVDVHNAEYSWGWEEFYRDCEIRDLLDSLTLAHRHFEIEARNDRGYSFNRKRNALIDRINRIFTEENIAYRMQKDGEIHYSVDREFSKSQASTIAALEPDRYRNALNEFKGAQLALDSIPHNGKDAIRRVFTSAECVFRLMFPYTTRLGTKEVRDQLGPALQKLLNDPTTLQVSLKLAKSFEHWIEAAHFFRHEAGTEEIAQPPLSLAIALTSQGSAFIRWLAELDELALKGNLDP